MIKVDVGVARALSEIFRGTPPPPPPPVVADCDTEEGANDDDEDLTIAVCPCSLADESVVSTLFLLIVWGLRVPMVAGDDRCTLETMLPVVVTVTVMLVPPPASAAALTSESGAI